MEQHGNPIFSHSLKHFTVGLPRKARDECRRS
jgi:hypothetical protein